jgi:hypothetical protein
LSGLRNLHNSLSNPEHIFNVNFLFQQSVCCKVFTKSAVGHIRQMEILPPVRVMFGWIHIDRLVYAAVNR